MWFIIRTIVLIACILLSIILASAFGAFSIAWYREVICHKDNQFILTEKAIDYIIVLVSGVAFVLMMFTNFYLAYLLV